MKQVALELDPPVRPLSDQQYAGTYRALPNQLILPTLLKGLNHVDNALTEQHAQPLQP